MQVHGEQGPERVRVHLQGGGGARAGRQLRLPVRVLHAGLARAAGLQPHPDRRPRGQQGVRHRHAQGVQVEGQNISGHSPAAGKKFHSGKNIK